MTTLATDLRSALGGLHLDRAWSAEAKIARRELARVAQDDRSFTLGAQRRDALRLLQEAYDQATVENWDGYGAMPADASSLDYAREFLLMLPSDIPNPEASVDPDGEIAFDWDYGPRRVFSVSVGRDGTLTYAGLFGYNKSHGVEVHSNTAPAAVLAGLKRVLQ